MTEISFKSYGERCTVKFNDSPEIMKAVFEKLINGFYFNHRAFTGESIMQRDDPQVSAPEILSEIADGIIKFEVKWESEDSHHDRA